MVLKISTGAPKISHQTVRFGQFEGVAGFQTDFLDSVLRWPESTAAKTVTTSTEYAPPLPNTAPDTEAQGAEINCLRMGINGL